MHNSGYRVFQHTFLRLIYLLNPFFYENSYLHIRYFVIYRIFTKQPCIDSFTNVIDHITVQFVEQKMFCSHTIKTINYRVRHISISFLNSCQNLNFWLEYRDAASFSIRIFISLLLQKRIAFRKLVLVDFMSSNNRF